MRSRGCLLGLFGAIVGLALVAVLVDAGARHYATSRVENRIRASAPESRGVTARIHSWPFLQVAVNGHISEIGAHVVRLVEKPLVFSDVDVDLRGVSIDQGTLGSQGRLVVTHIDSGNVTLTVTPSDLAVAAGVPVALSGAVTGAAPGHVKIAVDGAKRELVVDVSGVRRFAFALPGVNVVPCVPNVSVTGVGITLACTFTRVPDALTALAS